jgi:hypothetical protein
MAVKWQVGRRLQQLPKAQVPCELLQVCKIFGDKFSTCVYSFGTTPWAIKKRPAMPGV